MDAAVGDKLVIKGHRVGDHDRVGIIREVRGDHGEPPYVVEWADSDGEHTIWPGSDALVEKFEHHPAPK